MLLAALVRLNRSGDLSLWLDEGLTVGYTRLPWDVILGLHGPYDQHPPLYFALVKLVSLSVPEVYAGRLISVIAGTLSVPVVYALARRLLDRRAGVVAATVVAFAPLLVWFSQEGRMYAVTGLFVALAYLAFFALVQTGSKRWALIYGASLWIAMQLDYSALFALLPHGVLIPMAIVRDRRRGMLVLAAAVASAVAYLPWLVMLPGTLPGITDRASYLGFSMDKAFSAIVSVVGLDATTYAPSPTGFASVWNLATISHRPLLLLVAAIGVGGTVLLARRSGMAAVAAAGLVAGTIVAAALFSVLLTPSFADRTVSYATFGWALLVAAAAGPVLTRLVPGRRPPSVERAGASGSDSGVFSTESPRAPTGRRWTGVAAVCAAMLLAVPFAAGLVTLRATQATGDKQHWRDLVHDVAMLAGPASPVITYPRDAMGIFVDLYAPGAVVGRPFYLDGGHPVTAQTLAAAGNPGIVWYGYDAFQGYDRRSAELVGLGYRLLTRRIYFQALVLEAYALPGQPSWVPIDVGAIDGALVPEVPATGGLYQLGVDVQAGSADPASLVTLTCESGDPDLGDVYPNTGAPADVRAAGERRHVTVTGLCGSGTTALTITLRAPAGGSVRFGAVTLGRAGAPGP